MNKNSIISLCKTFLFLFLLTGLLYPALITGIAQLFFTNNANGSLFYIHGVPRGSYLLGQEFRSPHYFHSRPSFIHYNPNPSASSNWSLTSDRLQFQTDSLTQRFRQVNSLDSSAFVPSEMIFSSASGVDPHISVTAALLQLNRVSKVRGLSHQQVSYLRQFIGNGTELSDQNVSDNSLVNVLYLNYVLDSLSQK